MLCACHAVITGYRGVAGDQAREGGPRAGFTRWCLRRRRVFPSSRPASPRRTPLEGGGWDSEVGEVQHPRSRGGSARVGAEWASAGAQRVPAIVLRTEMVGPGLGGGSGGSASGPGLRHGRRRGFGGGGGHSSRTVRTYCSSRRVSSGSGRRSSGTSSSCRRWALEAPKAGGLHPGSPGGGVHDGRWARPAVHPGPEPTRTARPGRVQRDQCRRPLLLDGPGVP